MVPHSVSTMSCTSMSTFLCAVVEIRKVAVGQRIACALEKRSEYGAAGQGLADLDTVTRTNPLRSYPYRYRAAVMMDTLREREAIGELSRAIAFKVSSWLL